MSKVKRPLPPMPTGPQLAKSRAREEDRLSPKKLRWQNVASRVVAAAVGGYVLTYAATACLTVLLPFPKTEAILTAAMFSFVLYTGAILWAFAAATPGRVWLGLLVPAAVCGAIALPFALSLGG
jgi:hypothetical protein